MKLLNKSTNGLSHIVTEIVNGKPVEKTYFLGIGQNLDVPEEVAKIWLKIKGVEKYVSPEDLTKLEAKKDEEIAKLKKELAESKKEKKTAKKTAKK